MKPIPRCPCCNQIVLGNIEPYRLVEHLPVSGLQRTMARILAASFGREVPADLLMSVLWSGPDGGPPTAREALRLYAHQLRALLRPHGITITGRRKRCAGGFQMHWIAESAVQEAGRVAA